MKSDCFILKLTDYKRGDENLQPPPKKKLDTYFIGQLMKIDSLRHLKVFILTEFYLKLSTL